MKLIDLLVQELPKRGGWPEGFQVICSHGNGHIYAHSHSGKVSGRHLNIYGCQGQSVTLEQYEAALAAAQPPVWGGEGLPPAGCECEFFDCEKWFKVTMMYGGSQLVVLYDHDNQIERSFSTSRIDGKFRPIRSEADRKRDEAIAALKKLKPQLVGELAGYLYDEIAAGKIPHIRIEQAA
ncbi:TPA: hypothetical protein JD192_01385 [Cronobacter sakazakii]|nr:hypothetical protein [Cronobacter sakazakii]